MKKGKIEVTNNPQTLDCGKITKISQKGITPIFNHKYIISIEKKSEICSIICGYIIIEI